MLTKNTLQHEPREIPQPIAGILAIILPGLGHLWLRQPRRATMIALGISFLTIGGLLIGGIDTLDRSEDKWWFLGQAGIGPTAFALNSWHQHLKHEDPYINAEPTWFDTNQPGRTKSLAHSNEIGSLWIAIAGMLNLIAVIDASWHVSPRHKTSRRAEDTT